MSIDLRHLRRLAAGLGSAVTVDDIARVTLAAAVDLPGALRAGTALNRSGGRQLQFVSSDEDRLGPSLRWCLIDAYDNVPLNDAVRAGEDVYLGTADQIEAAYPGFGEHQRSLGIRSMVALALATEHDRLGGLMICFADEQDFDYDARCFFAALAAQVTQALRNELMQQLQQTSSEQLQRSLMPPSLPEPAGLSVGAHYQPGGLNSDVGGDWYDVFELPDGSTAIALGDVMGKGVPAAIVMGEIRSALRAYTFIDATPSVVLALLDAFVSSRTEPEQLVTVVYGVITPDRDTITYSVAGHPPPLLVEPTGPTRLLDASTGPALGFSAGPWPDATEKLSDQSLLLFYSDGLVEARDIDLFAGIEALMRHVDELPRRRRRPHELCTQLSLAMDHGEPGDDSTRLAVGLTPAATTRSATLPLPGDTSAPGLARRFIRSRLEDWDAPAETIETATLCVSELVTNAVIHSGTPAEVRAELDDGYLTVYVRDHGSGGTVEVSPESDATRISGRGLTLVDALATAWHAEQTPDGTSVWFELSVTGDSSVESA
ncbi:MAG: ATP-binding SpoIIE family protein phosphatase [Nocardioidaceae bacterium]